MEIVEELPGVTSSEAPSTTCANCGSSALAPYYKTPLCSTCRNQFINYPFPLWIKAFGVVLLITLAFCLLSLPGKIQTGIHYKRGEVAAEQHQYLTAQKEFTAVLEQEADYKDAQCQLLIAAFYNGNIERVAAMYSLLEGKEIENNDLLNQVSQVLTKAAYYVPGDSLNRFIEAAGVEADSIKPQAYYTYLKANPDDIYAKAHFASILFESEAYKAADSLLNETLQNDAGYIPALTLKTPLKRELEQYDSSTYYANRLLAINQDYTYAHSSKVRNLLRQKKDKEGLRMAIDLNDRYKDDTYLLSSLALAYHFNKDSKNRDLILQQASKDSTKQGPVQYVKDVIAGKEIFRTN